MDFIQLNNQIIEKIDENHFISYDNNNKSINFLNYDEKENNFICLGSVTFNENILSISHSTFDNKVFLCLLTNYQKIKELFQIYF